MSEEGFKWTDETTDSVFGPELELGTKRHPWDDKEGAWAQEGGKLGVGGIPVSDNARTIDWSDLKSPAEHKEPWTFEMAYARKTAGEQVMAK